MNETKKREKRFFLKLFSYAFLFFSFAFFFLLFPKEIASSVVEGIELCLKVVVPSLFPFMVLSSSFSQSELCEKLGRLFKRPIKFFFSLGSSCFSPVLISLFGGYPTAAFCAGRLFEKGLISKSDFQKTLLFCINPSPSFAIGAVGAMLLGSKKDGVIIFFSVLFSSLLLGIFSKFVKTESEEDKMEKSRFSPSFPPFSKLLVDSIAQSGQSILFICFSVLFFSSALAVTDRIFPSKKAALFFGALFEVTNGVKRCCGILPPEIIAGIVAFSGLCTHFQVMNEVSLSGLRTSVFMTFRLLHGALSTVVCSVLFKIFPRETDVFSQQAHSVSLSCASSLPFSLCLCAMCVLLMLGNNFVISKKRESG